MLVHILQYLLYIKYCKILLKIIFRPPCIPYVGLVLQDLTFVHIGNPDTFDNKVNFAKRWQQFNILVSPIMTSHIFFR